MPAHPLKLWAIVCIVMVPVCTAIFYYTIPRVDEFMLKLRVRCGGAKFDTAERAWPCAPHARG